MNKRILCGLMAIMMLFALGACGRKKEESGVDYYEIGYKAISAKQYRAALDNFLIAAEQGDEQAENAAKIVSAYLEAKEALEKDNKEKAKAILDKIPENYKYYAIGEDVDALRQMLYQEQEEKEEEQETPEPVEEEKEQSHKVNNDLSPEKAAKYLKSAYPDVEGDVGGALVAQYDENGNLFYSLTIQIGEEIKTIHILEDGTVQEIG